jgi:hypothetical protein
VKESRRWAAGEHLKKRAARGSRRKFERALRKVNDVEPDERDRLLARGNNSGGLSHLFTFGHLSWSPDLRYTLDMATATVLDRIFDPLGDVLTPESARRLVAWRADDETQQRLDELGDKCNEGELTAAEREEYEAYVRAIDFIAILQAKARAVLQRNGG